MHCGKKAITSGNLPVLSSELRENTRTLPSGRRCT
jgi:hypothetical protein